MSLPDTIDTDVTGLVPPNLLIFYHIPKAGGTTMEFVLANCFPGDQHFSSYVGVPDSAASIADRGMIAEKYNLLSAEARQAIRCVAGGHVPVDIHTLFDRPAKYFTIIRHPVDRVISSFYFIRDKTYAPHFEVIKDMTLEEYLDSRVGLDPFDHQVRMLSGCEELDGPWGVDGKPVPAAPVEARHLEMAKQNIEKHFITAAPLEEFSTLVVLLKRLYGWNLRNCLYELQNVTARRPQVDDVPKATRQRIEDYNRYDMELYEWTKTRFANQISALDPQISRDRYLFDIVNSSCHRLRRMRSKNIRKAVTNLVRHSFSKEKLVYLLAAREIYETFSDFPLLGS
jgi:Galactose-3-O-sulfotransferase